MARRSKEAVFRTLVGALALAEERTSIPLAEAATILEVTRDELREMLEPVLFQEFVTASGDRIDRSRSFLLTEDDSLTVETDHWLRDLVSVAPDADTALRLLVAGTVIKSLSARPMPHLDAALRKLERKVSADVVVALDAPPHLATVERAHVMRRTLRCRYVNDRGEVRDRELEPWFVFSNWGRWYVQGRDLADAAVKWFRVDRMSAAELGPGNFEPPEGLDVPEWFELGDEQTVTLRVAGEVVDALPTPRRVELVGALPGGRVEVRVTVYGRQRLEHLLVVLPPEAEVVEPEHERLRREHAERLLASYD